jgi:hypothetical protein
MKARGDVVALGVSTFHAVGVERVDGRSKCELAGNKIKVCAAGQVHRARRLGDLGVNY